MKSQTRSLAFAIALLSAIIGGTIEAAVDRVPWTTSRIHGTPEPPLPYVVERAFPNLTFDRPMEVTTLPGTSRLVLIEQGGKIFSFPNENACAKADLCADMKQFGPETSECYAITFHPRFAENRFVYVWIQLDAHGKSSRDEGTRIVRLRVTKEAVPRLDFASSKLIISWLHAGHNGGNMRFGPDGMLYISTGDGGMADPPDGRVTGQDISDLLSSVLRIDVDHPDPGRAYGIPKDNPFVNTPNARGEVWAYGLRNPWRMAFDPKSGELYAGDVGWELWEMILRIQRGGNYGWSITEGGKQDVRPDRLRGPTPILPPLVAHPHEDAASITGGEFYHGKKLPELKGAYLYGDWQMGTFWSLRADGDRVTELRELCHTPLMPVGFGITPDGELLICDHAGGGLWQFAPNARAGKPVNFPRKLSETGLFSDAAKQTSAPGVLPYTIHAPRWADHATSERWVAFPETSGAVVADRSLGILEPGRWIFPADGVLAKTYSLELERGNPSTRRRIETQVLHYDGAQMAAYSYRWNEAQTDADLVSPRGDEVVFSVKDPAAPGGTLAQKWRFFSRVECIRCHSLWNNGAPGFTALQLARVTPDSPGHQLDTLTRLGITPDEPKLVDPYGSRGSAEVRARSYLHTNCGTCHRLGGGGSVPAFMNIEKALGESRLIRAKPVQGDFGLPEAQLIAPGDPARSVLLYRMATAGRGHMPYLGGRLVDDRGLLVVRDWIAGMKSNPKDLLPATRKQREAEEALLARLKTGDGAALELLLASPSGALGVAFAVVDGSLTGDLRAQAIAKGSASPDPVRRDLFERYLPESQRRRVLGSDIKPAEILAMKGDAPRGKVLFMAVCAACHHAQDVGIDFGPELSHIATKWNRQGLIEQILFPSKIIDPQWQLATVKLPKQDPKVGFIAARNDEELTLKMAGGATEKIPTRNIASTTTQRVSLMPEGLLQSLTAQEAGDLIEFLASLK
jgi:putative heme-binding domain-containing protein